ncbi:MAG TPA: methylene-tetrahydromethanopterin dehydrogenase N-terminal domain-containing protein [Candidatus Acidoferrum sp.]|nr:methylene-tetrahydromethanopterin dehydrogenase N-terminal domain-containing protein [Candidatus Acidoferrum sp.]
MAQLQPTFKTVFVFLDTDKYCSPFDMLVATDAFPDSMIFKYENVTSEDAPKIVFDLLFPRGPEGAKHTKIFINGSNFEMVEKVVEATQKAMKSAPWGNSIIVDPRGGYSTAAAAVAKTFGAAMEKGFGTLEGKKVTVLAGTGPVGQTAARIYAAEKANVTITSRTMAKGQAVADKINQEVGAERVKVVEVAKPEQTADAVKDAEIVLSAGAGGIQLLSQAQIGASCKIVADINAIKPLGVECLGSNDDGKEIKPGVFGIGALAIGKLKIKTETEMIKRATAEPQGLFDYSIAYTIAKDAILKKLAKAAAK